MCNGNCLQGRACTCWRRDWADKRDYTPAHSARAENLLVLAALVYFVLLVALGVL